MQAIPTDGKAPRAAAGAHGDGRLHREMQASTRALLAAHDAHVQEAMRSVRWERRGLLQRLTRDGR